MATTLSYTDAEILLIAKHQKTVIWLIVLSVLVQLLPLIFVSAFVTVGMLIFLVAGFVITYRFAASLHEGAPVVYAIVGLIPFLGLLALGILNSRAIALLEARGIKVGVMGVSQRALSAIASNAFAAAQPPVILPVMTSASEERLRRFEGLLRQNLISQSEFDAKRAEILNGH